jgi:large subunit ribosomal protein L24
MNKIRKGDEVVVITGKDKGRRGTVTRVLPTGKLLVEGINVAKKHQKPIPNQGVGGGIVEKEIPIQISNVMLWNAKADKGDRVGFKIMEGKDKQPRKIRVFKSNGEAVDA